MINHSHALVMQFATCSLVFKRLLDKCLEGMVYSHIS